MSEKESPFSTQVTLAAENAEKNGAHESPFSNPERDLPPAEYLRKKEVATLLNEAIETMLERRPEEPAHFLQSFFLSKTGQTPTFLSPTEQHVPLVGGSSSNGGSPHSGMTPHDSIELSGSRVRRRSSLRRGSTFGSWVSTNADRALATKTRYDDGINDIKFGAVRNTARDESERGKVTSFPDFLECVRIVCEDHKLPQEEIVEAVLDHLRKVDPNEWLSDVEVIAISSLYLYSFETFRTAEERGGSVENGNRRGTDHHVELKTTTPPYWYVPNTRKRMARPLQARIEGLYRTIPEPTNLLINPLAAKCGVSPVSGEAVNRSPSAKAKDLSPSEKSLLGLFEQIYLIMQMLDSGTSHSLDTELLCNVCRDLWVALVSELQQISDAGAKAASTESQPVSIKHFLGESVFRSLDEETSTSFNTFVEKEEFLIRSYLDEATAFEALALLENIMSAEHLPVYNADAAAGGADGSSSGSPYHTCMALISFKEGGTAFSMVSPDLPESGLGMVEITRYAVPESLSVRSVLQKCCATKNFSDAEMVLYNALSDALTYHSGFESSTTKRRDVSGLSEVTTVYKVLASYFSTSRYFSVGSVLSATSPSLATASRTRVNMVLSGCISDTIDAPPPVKFELKTKTAVPLGVHSMLPRANEVIIPGGTSFIVDGNFDPRILADEMGGDTSDDDNSSTSARITMTELENSHALNYHLRHMLKNAPSEASCSLVWDILEGKRILKLENDDDDGSLADWESKVSGPNSIRWQVLLESAEVPLEDIIELYDLQISLQEFEHLLAAHVGGNPSAGSSPSATAKVSTTENGDEEVTINGRYDQLLQINFRTKRGKLTDSDGQQKPISLRTTANERGMIHDSDVSFLCSLLRLDPPVQHLSIVGHTHVSDIGAEYLLHMLSHNTMLKSVRVRRCRISVPSAAAIYALSSTNRRNGKITIATGSKWQHKTQQELERYLQDLRSPLASNILTPADRGMKPDALNIINSSGTPSPPTTNGQVSSGSETPIDGKTPPALVDDQLDPFAALGRALMQTHSLLNGLEIMKGGDITLLFADCAMWEHISDVVLDNVFVDPEKMLLLKAQVSGAGNGAHNPHSPTMKMSPDRIERDAHLGWGGIRGLTRLRRLRITNIDDALPSEAIRAICGLISKHKLTTLEFEEVQMSLPLFEELVQAIVESTVLQNVTIDKTDILNESNHDVSIESSSNEPEAAAIIGRWKTIAEHLHDAKSITNWQMRCCTGVTPYFEEQAMRVTMRNKLSRGDVTQEEYDEMVQDLGIDISQSNMATSMEKLTPRES